jgi:hypothetical protein
VKSSIKQRLRSISVNQRRKQGAKSAVSIHALKEPVLSYITIEIDNEWLVVASISILNDAK